MGTMTILKWFCRKMGAGVLILGMSGCVMPAPPSSIDEPVEARRDTISRSLHGFEPGTATRRDVVLALGEPDAVSLDECMLIYWSPKDVTSWFIYIPLGMSDTYSDWDVDYFVAEFDAAGVLIDFEEEENWPALVPSLSTYGGQKVLFQHEAEMIKCIDWLPDYYKLQGIAVLTETELVFMSNKLIANTPPDLRLTYSSMTEEQIEGFIGKAMRVRCRSGAEFKFRMDHQRRKSDPLQVAHGIIQSKLTQ